MNDRKQDDLARQQAKEIEDETLSLRSGHWDLGTRRYREFFQHAKRISELFKNARSIPSAERQKLWDSFSLLCDRVRQDENREKESLAGDSRVKKGPIESNIREASLWGRCASSIDELRKGEELLSKAAEQMKDGWAGFTWTTELTTLSMGRLTKEDRDDLWTKWRAAKQEIRERRNYLSDLNYQHMHSVAEACLGIAHSDPRETKKKIQAANGEMKQRSMSREQYAEIQGILDRAWELASYAAKQRQNEWRERMEGHIARWVSLMEKNDEIIKRLEGQVEDCEEMETNARTEDFAEQVRGWIEEKLDKMRDIRETNQELEDKIESAKRKLSGG